jgi:hypothetical protein
MENVRDLCITIFDADDDAELRKEFARVVKRIDEIARANGIIFVINYAEVRGGVRLTVGELDTLIALGFVAELLSLARRADRVGEMSFRIEWTVSKKPK